MNRIGLLTLSLILVGRFRFLTSCEYGHVQGMAWKISYRVLRCCFGYVSAGLLKAHELIPTPSFGLRGKL